MAITKRNGIISLGGVAALAVVFGIQSGEAEEQLTEFPFIGLEEQMQILQNQIERAEVQEEGDCFEVFLDLIRLKRESLSDRPEYNAEFIAALDRAQENVEAAFENPENFRPVMEAQIEILQLSWTDAETYKCDVVGDQTCIEDRQQRFQDLMKMGRETFQPR